MLKVSPIKFPWLALLAAVLLLPGCEEVYTPKERGYPRFDLPPHEYVPYDEDHPYRFEVSRHARVYPDTDRLTEPHWINIKYPSLSAEVQITYKPLSGDRQRLAEHIHDALKLVDKHNIKAYGVEHGKMVTGTGSQGQVFALSGQVPTQFQFYTTDSVRHFLRGALYFRTATENDSLAPAIQYISQDMIHLLKTLQWKNPVGKTP